MVSCYALALYLLSLTLDVLPVGVVYAVWSGSGVALITVVGRVVFKQALDRPALIGIALIMAGVFVLQLFSGHRATLILADVDARFGQFHRVSHGQLDVLARHVEPRVARDRCQRAKPHGCLTISTEISIAGIVPLFSSQCVVFLSSGQPTPGP
jgi:hypothetical protein